MKLVLSEPKNVTIAWSIYANGGLVECESIETSNRRAAVEAAVSRVLDTQEANAGAHVTANIATSNFGQAIQYDGRVWRYL